MVVNRFQYKTSKTIVLGTVLLSGGIHLMGVVALGMLEAPVPDLSKQVHVAKVKITEKKPETEPTPVPVSTPAPTPVATVPPPLKEPPKPKPEKTRKARAREDERVKPEEINPEPVEIRGGLSDSTALNSNLATGPSVAQGNSAEVGVDPSKGDLPPPAPVPVGTNSDVVDYAAIAVEEAFASSSADCAGALPELELSDDAVNAGLTSGQLIIEVIVDDKGIVRQPKLIKGTGYQIDAIALKEVQKMKCNPAQENGKSTVVRKELRFEVVDY